MYLAFQAVHAPPEVPQYYIPIYGAKIKDHKRANFAGMLGAMDEGVGNVTSALSDKEMMDNVIILFTGASMPRRSNLQTRTISSNCSFCGCSG